MALDPETQKKVDEALAAVKKVMSGQISSGNKTVVLVKGQMTFTSPDRNIVITPVE